LKALRQPKRPVPMTNENPAFRHRAKAEAGTALRFAIVGAAATITHASVALLLFEGGILGAFAANIGGFLVAFGVSFIGHHHWSFASTRHNAKTGQRMRRFFVLALAGFALNSGVLASWLGLTSWPESLGILFSIAVVPALSFAGARLWAFSGAGKPSSPSTDRS
jgi:putative flippase GtrA